MPTFEIDVVDQHHGRVRVQVLHLVFDHVSRFACDVSVDLGCSRSGFVKVDFEELSRVVVCDIIQVPVQRTEALAHRCCVPEKQLLVPLAGRKHVE